MIHVNFPELRSRGEAFVLYFEDLYCFEPTLFHNISLFARALQCTLACVLDIFAGCCGCELDLRPIGNIFGKIKVWKILRWQRRTFVFFGRAMGLRSLRSHSCLRSTALTSDETKWKTLKGSEICDIQGLT